ncbi:MAG: class B sortase [Lachnospiraceae bacterium]|nr:class B sortase [Lachnospiraceae bacterium]
MKRQYLAGAVLLAGISFFCIALYCYQKMKAPSEVEVLEEKIRTEMVDLEPGEESVVYEESAVYESPIDFENLQKANPDIYAWLYIEGTNISYPVLQHPDDDTYYLTHTSSGEKEKKGTLYTEKAYNSKSFDDPLTVIYGHHLKSGEMFGKLQETYSEENAMEKYGNIIIYMPEEEIHYKVFAAVPYKNYHLLGNDDTTDPAVFGEFLDSMYQIRAVGAIFNEDEKATTADKVLVLSTCLIGNNKRRYLVLGKRI